MLKASTRKLLKASTSHRNASKPERLRFAKTLRSWSPSMRKYTYKEVAKGR